MFVSRVLVCLEEGLELEGAAPPGLPDGIITTIITIVTHHVCNPALASPVGNVYLS